MSLPPHLSSSTSSQTSKGCGDPPETPAPATPETGTDSTRPDVLPPLYDDLNTLSRKVSVVSFFGCHIRLMSTMLSMQKEEPPSMPMYHVLEGPTPVESAPETLGTEVCVCVCFMCACISMYTVRLQY